MKAAFDFKEISNYIKSRAQSAEFRDYMVKMLSEMVGVNNTPTQPLATIAANEKKVLDIVEKAVREIGKSDVTVEHAPIDPDISEHPYYTHPYYTADGDNPKGLPVETVYKDRYNLFAIVKPEQSSDRGRAVILNAHVDTVAPYYPLKKDDKYLYGRGAVDDKGSVVTLVASLKLLAEVEAKFGKIPAQPQVYQFVIEEETGGNGSLSAAMDKRFVGYEAIICEATEGIPYPANRGAMWFRMDMATSAGNNVAEIIPFILAELAKEGQQLRSETNLPLFPKEYVQVNLGGLDNVFGEHPSSVQNYLAYEFTIRGEGKDPLSLLKSTIDQAILEYCRIYADRTKEANPDTGKAKLEKHYQLTEIGKDGKGRRYKLEVFGIAGHMSALLLCDNALIKGGYIMQALISTLYRMGEEVEYRLAYDKFDANKLLLLGGVGFTPAHPMEQLQRRMREAARRGIRRYNQAAKKSVNENIITMTFDMLHNEAYASPVDCPAMQAFQKAYRRMGLAWPKPVAFRASCDARIYGNNGHNTITFGPGMLADAHSDQEKIAIDQMQKGLELVTLTTLALTSGEEI